MTKLSDIRDTGLTLLIGGVSAVIADLLGIAAPYLTGPALMVTFAALAGLRTHVPDLLRDFCMLILGIGIGAGVTPEVIQAAAAWPVSFLALVAVLFLTIKLNVMLFSRLFRFSRAEATVAAVPGLLSYTIAIAEDKGMNVARVSLIQTLRVMLLTLLVPPVMGLIPKGDAAPQDTVIMGYAWILVLIVVGLGVAWLLRRKNIPAAVFLAGFVVSAISHLTETTPGTLPSWIGLSAFAVIGTLIGSRFQGVSMADLKGAIIAGLAMTLVASLIALAGGAAVAMLLGLPTEALFISFAPGGLEVMIALAAQMGVDGTFVAAHHIARLLILMVLIPVLLRGLQA
ncbi:AbrB family transcriptional regulator [Halocynthiibacter sp.]|uniref:AbrB family transcriptional regulator n=1 Tax=Halocynthiibacter sp. TaxID=1979210 RepID=UPI003C54B8E4